MTYAPWRYKDGQSKRRLKRALAEYFRADTFLFASGREALLAFLRSIELQPGDEVIVQGYTCIVVPNAIHAAGGRAVYADITRDTLNLDVADVERRITGRTKAVICQHTFGIPAPVQELRQLCIRHSLLLIEDCAHVIPDDRGPAEIGMLGDAVLLSFGRDKAISGVGGGAMVVRHEPSLEPLQALEHHAKPLSWWRINHFLSYPLLYRRALPVYRLGLGKFYLRVQRWLGRLIPITTDREKAGEMDPTLHAMPNACAFLALDQFRRLRQLNDHRRRLTAAYLKLCREAGWLKKHSPVYVPRAVQSALPLQKFPLFTSNTEQIRSTLKPNGMYLEDGWTNCVVCPAAADEESAGYERGCARQAEAVAQSILSLPAHPTMPLKAAPRLVTLLRAAISQARR